MIDNQRYQIVMECDTCAAVEESEKGELFRTFWPRMKDEGWKSKSVGKGPSAVWVHACPKCEL